MIFFTRGTGNVFADLAMPDAAERQTKTRLTLEINKIIKARKLKQVDAGRLLGIPQSRFPRYRTIGWTVFPWSV